MGAMLEPQDSPGTPLNSFLMGNGAGDPMERNNGNH